MTDYIADRLGVEAKEIMRPPKIINQVPATQDEFTKILVTHKREDYISARDNIKNLIAEVELVVSDAVDEVRSNPSARMFETFSLLVKTFAELNKDLLSLSGPQNEKGKNDQESERTPINNVVFVGTSDALIDQIRSQMK